MSVCTLHPLPYHADPRPRFARIQAAPGACLLDGGRPHAERGRFELFSAWPEQTLAPRPDEDGRAFLARCRAALAELGRADTPAGVELPFTGGLLGYLAYDFGRRLERLPAQAADDLALPDARLGLYAWALVTDHRRQTSQLVFHPRLTAERRAALIALFEAGADAPPADDFRLLAPFAADLDAGQYRAAIERIQDYIRAGDCYQVNFAQRFQAPCRGQPWGAYDRLREACPTPFAGYLALEDGAILSLSPERFISVQAGQVETRPIKGTRPRFADPDEDARSACELQTSAKEIAELVMITDLLRNDLGQVCEFGSVEVSEMLRLESLAQVHHLVSTVTGTLRPETDAIDALAACFPGGSITGAPKKRAMEIIRELEARPRGIYCGAIGWLGFNGGSSFNIAIRTLVREGNHLVYQVGAGIVADSDPDKEYEETLHKAAGIRLAVERWLDA